MKRLLWGVLFALVLGLYGCSSEENKETKSIDSRLVGGKFYAVPTYDKIYFSFTSNSICSGSSANNH